MKIVIEQAAMLRPNRPRWAWRVVHWYSDDPDNVIVQGVTEGTWWHAMLAIKEALDEPAQAGTERTDMLLGLTQMGEKNRRES